MRMTRQRFLAMTAGALSAGAFLSACSAGADEPGGARDDGPEAADGDWYMPAEDTEHAATWMCWPSTKAIWGRELIDAQETIARVARAIADFEPVRMLVRPAALPGLRRRLGSDVELIEAPVDDLWARDTLPCFLTRDGGSGLAAGHVRFNGWGGKQRHSGDTRLAQIVAERLGVPIVASGLVGEGGGLEVDGDGTVLAAESSWVNDNRNPGMSRDRIEQALLELLGADRMVWVTGLAGADITDGHIDTLARFVVPGTIVVDTPAFDDPDDPWVRVAGTTRAELAGARTAEGAPFEILSLRQPEAPRGGGPDFLSTYMNYYLCNDALIAPEFGDRAADDRARGALAEWFPDRAVVMLPIDPVAAGGGGIHCATQQQPATA